jgi:phenylpropionate dioxygenase-like ring-hydroxylating dioxygenase large terminal subunit
MASVFARRPVDAKRSGGHDEAMPLAPVAVYDRTVTASLERVWENVLDWEHLPWLHDTTFGHVRLLGATPAGFRAETSLAHGGAPFVIDVATDRAGLRYHSRTIAGPGAGTDIVTTLTPAAPHATGVHVEFLVPDVAPERRDAVGAVFVALYTRLWDEDQAMMVRRQAYVDGRLPAGRREVALDGAPCAFSTTCPHLGGPLDDAAVDATGVVTCPWHGWRFDVRTGRRVEARGGGRAPA